MRGIEYLVTTLLAATLTACVKSDKQAPERSFELQAKCDQLVREKFDLMETNSRFVYPALSMSVTSNLKRDGTCYGHLVRYAKGGSNEILLNGLTGKELVVISIAGREYVSVMLLDKRGEWSTVEYETANKRISDLMN